jgi:maleylacetate reductase
MALADQTFLYNGLPTRVVFGSGTSAQTGNEARRIGMKRPLVLSTPEQANEAQELAATIAAPRVAQASACVVLILLLRKSKAHRINPVLLNL